MTSGSCHQFRWLSESRGVGPQRNAASSFPSELLGCMSYNHPAGLIVVCDFELLIANN